MKKRVIFSVALVLGIASFMLVVTIFQLYKEAEKVQRSIFTSEVLSAGSQVINKIDNLLKGDTLLALEMRKEIDDSTAFVVLQKHAKKFLLDSARLHPVGVIRTTISYMRNDVVITNYDTVYFDTTYNKTFAAYNFPWENDISLTDFTDVISKNRSKKHIDLIEMDTNTINLLNEQYLNRIIKEALQETNINADFDFALYNAVTTQFVVLPRIVTPETILKSEFVFSLKPLERCSAPHYLIIYFKAERRIFFQRMSTITSLITLLMTIIAIFSSYTLYHLYRQKKISEIKNDLINNMTHEFKTPISTISLACEALSDKDMLTNDQTRSTYISIIDDENERLKKMVNNILQLAQLKKGQLKIEVEKFDIHELIKHICDNFSLQISSKNGKIFQYLYAQNPFIFADITHIENVIINLIENAIKYSPENPAIVIRTANEKKNIVISIADKGIGISKKNQKKIFHEFYRISSGNVHNTKGHGLGLVYVKKIIELHEGAVSVRSAPEQGSIFTIILPNKK